MNYSDKMEWFSPDRIMKLYPGEKSSFGSRRLFVIGIGANGADCLIRCKDIAENRYTADKSKLRFLGIGLKDDLDKAERNGSVLLEDERLEIDPDGSIYPYLNDPELLPEAAKSWFDEGLRNYTPAKPVYGLTKRQCARVALFHYFASIMKIFGDAINDFSGDKSPIEIVFTGNLGDAFFGGMVIDLAYIIKAMFASAKFSVSVNAYMLAGDTALLQGADGRALAIFYANTIVTKTELDKFQFQKKKYSQKFAENYVFSSDKPPFQCCTINAAEETYDATADNIAYKIMAGTALVFKKDDDAERLLAYNMFNSDAAHTFRYICEGCAVEELPIGKLTSFITLKMIVLNYNYLLKKSAGEPEIAIIASKAATSAMFLAQKGGELPKFEFDETLNPLFSVKSIKNGIEASKKYVNDRLEIIAGLCKKGAEIFIGEIYDEIRTICEQARYDNEKGPYYAVDILRKCLAELKSSITAVESGKIGAADSVEAEERKLIAEYRAVHGTLGLFGSKSNEAYIDQIKKYLEARRFELTADIMLDYYNRLYDKLDGYYENDLSVITDMFSAAIDMFHGIEEQMKPADSGFVRDAFNASDANVISVLNRIVDELPETTTSLIFKRSKILKTITADGDSAVFAREAVGYTADCFHNMLGLGFDDLCKAVGANKNTAGAIGNCLERMTVNTPAEEEPPLIRVLCPNSTNAGSVAGLHAVHNSLNDIWSDSALLHTVMVEQVRAGVKLDKFKDYKQWENMRYAYVNDSLKKHGIHIFK